MQNSILDNSVHYNKMYDSASDLSSKEFENF